MCKIHGINFEQKKVRCSTDTRGETRPDPVWDYSEQTLITVVLSHNLTRKEVIYRGNTYITLLKKQEIRMTKCKQCGKRGKQETVRCDICVSIMDVLGL